MTWRELANLIDNMPECNKDQEANVWDGGESGEFYPIHGFSPYDESEEPNSYNFYSVNICCD